MPRIQLKPNSPEFADGGKPKPRHHRCDMEGCACEGEYKAPKSRDSNDYFWFCLEHVQDYNKAWDYFSGMSHNQIEEQIIRSALWDRPTRAFHSYADLKEELYRKAWKTYHYTEKEPPKDQASDRYRKSQISRNSPEFEAMAIMGIEPPLDLVVLKARYKELAKKYHPDINREDPKAEDILKSINMAYTILKAAHEKYAQLEQ
jgi:curved DNA-binding protein CbpA